LALLLLLLLLGVKVQLALLLLLLLVVVLVLLALLLLLLVLLMVLLLAMFRVAQEWRCRVGGNIMTVAVLLVGSGGQGPLRRRLRPQAPPPLAPTPHLPPRCRVLLLLLHMSTPHSRLRA
jgi:uncharacterized protein (DUF58 family)